MLVFSRRSSTVYVVVINVPVSEQSTTLMLRELDFDVILKGNEH